MIDVDLSLIDFMDATPVSNADVTMTAKVPKAFLVENFNIVASE